MTLEIQGYSDPVEYLIDKGYLARPIFQRMDGHALCSFSAQEISKLVDLVDIPHQLLDFDVRIWSHHDWDCVWEGGIDGFISGMKGVNYPRK